MWPLFPLIWVKNRGQCFPPLQTNGTPATAYQVTCQSKQRQGKKVNALCIHKHTQWLPSGQLFLGANNTYSPLYAIQCFSWVLVLVNWARGDQASACLPKGLVLRSLSMKWYKPRKLYDSWYLYLFLNTHVLIQKCFKSRNFVTKGLRLWQITCRLLSS